MAKFPPDDDDLPGPAPANEPYIGDLRDPDLAQIKRRTSNFGRILFLLIVVGGAVTGYLIYKQQQATAHKNDVWVAAQHAPSVNEFLRLIREDLPRTRFDDVKLLYIEGMTRHPDAASVPALIGALSDTSDSVRGQAALALARIGSPSADPAKTKLLEILPLTNIGHRAQVAWALAVLREPRASDAIITEFNSGLLQAQPGFDPKVIADVLGPTRLATLASGTPCAPPPAAPATGPAPAPTAPTPAGCVTVAVRTLIAQALAEAASPEAVTPLIHLLEDTDPEVVRTAAAGLGRTGDPAAGAPLFALLTRHPDMQQSIFDSMSRSIGARGMAQLLSAATDPALKLRLVEMLRRTHDPAAAEPLAAQLASTDAAMRSAAALGLAELGDVRAVPALVAIATGDNENMAQNALDALRALHAPVPSAELFAMLEAHPGRRAAVLHAVGASGDSSAGPFLERELAGDDVETALVALGELRYEPAYRGILAMVTRPRDIDFTEPSPANENAYRNRRKAIESLGYYGKPDAIPALITVIEDAEDDARLRATAGETLGILADDATMRTVIEKIRNESLDEASRRYYAQALWQKPTRGLAAELVGLLEGTLPSEVQRAVSLAIGYAADSTVDDRVNALFDNADKAREAMFAVVLGGSEPGATRLLTYLKDNPDAREVIDFALNSEDNDAFNVLLPEMFESGGIFRRMRVAQLLRDGTETGGHYSTPWQRLFERLNVGWSGPHGISAAVIREKLYQAMTGSDAANRSLAADILGDMGERGLLIRARDSGAVGSTEAREKLRMLNRVAS